MDCDFRPANSADANAAASLIYSSGPAAFDFVFATDRYKSGVNFLKYASTQRGGEFGFANHTVAVCDGQVVGVGARFTSQQALAFAASGVRQIVSFYGVVRSIGVIRRGLRTERFFKLPHRRKDYLGHLAVAPAFRGQGIGKSLLRHLLATGKEAGQTHAVLHVSTENPRAQALYERLGFQAVEERVSPLPGVPNHLEMELHL